MPAQATNPERPATGCVLRSAPCPLLAAAIKVLHPHADLLAGCAHVSTHNISCLRYPPMISTVLCSHVAWAKAEGCNAAAVRAGLRLCTSVFAVCQRGLGEDYLQLAGASSPNRPNTTHAACHCLRRRIVVRRVVRDAGTAAGPITSAVHRMKCYGLVLALCWTRRGAAKVLHGASENSGYRILGSL